MAFLPPKPELNSPALRLEVDPHMDDALQFLRDSQIEPEDSVELEINVIRNWRHERSSRSWSFWAPSIIGALAAAAALLAILQLAITPAATRPLSSSEDQSGGHPVLPSYSSSSPRR